MTPIKYDVFHKIAEDPSKVQTLMTSTTRDSLGKGKLHYVAAKDYKFANGKKLNLFLVVDSGDVKKFTDLMKTSAHLSSTGEASVVKDVKEGKPISKLVIHSATGNMNKATVVAHVNSVVAVKAAVAHAEEEAAEVVNKPDPKAMVRASIAQAKAEGKLEADHPAGAVDAHGKPKLNIEVTDAVADQMAKVSRETVEYGKFSAAYEKLATKYGFTHDPTYKQVPVNIWHDMIKAMANSGYLTKNIPNVGGDTRNLILAYEGPQGKVVREEQLRKAMAAMDIYTRHAEDNLGKVIQAVLANGGSTWAFWSGTSSKDAALKEAGDGVVLEGSVGSWFDEVYKFEHLTGVNDLVLWTSMSEMYAKTAAEYFDRFKFVGFLGPGATRDQSVFNKIEQPTFLEVLNIKKQVKPPHVDWYVVDCAFVEGVSGGYDQYKGKTGKWTWSEKASEKFTSRVSALANIVARYEK